MATVSAEIKALEKQLEESHKVADLVLIEVKAVFAKCLAKLQSIPQPVPKHRHLEAPPVKQLQCVKKEILFPTPGRAPTGNDYALPANPSYDNPIVAIHHHSSNNSPLKFETKDGVIGKHTPEPSGQFTRLAINPPGAAVAKIVVNKHTNYIAGIKLISKDGTVLVEAGYWAVRASHTQQEIALADGERLIGVRSKLYD